MLVWTTTITITPTFCLYSPITTQTFQPASQCLFLLRRSLVACRKSLQSLLPTILTLSCLWRRMKLSFCQKVSCITTCSQTRMQGLHLAASVIPSPGALVPLSRGILWSRSCNIGLFRDLTWTGPKSLFCFPLFRQILGRKLWDHISTPRRLSQPFVTAGICPLQRLLSRKTLSITTLLPCSFRNTSSTMSTRSSLSGHWSGLLVVRSSLFHYFEVPSAQWTRSSQYGEGLSLTALRSQVALTLLLILCHTGQSHGFSSSRTRCQLSSPSSVLDVSTPTSVYLSENQICHAGTSGSSWTLPTFHTS